MNEIEKVAVAGLKEVFEASCVKMEALKIELENRKQDLEELRLKQQQLLDLIEGIKELSKD